jgi:hypothetical protein
MSPLGGTVEVSVETLVSGARKAAGLGVVVAVEEAAAAVVEAGLLVVELLVLLPHPASAIAAVATARAKGLGIRRVSSLMMCAHLAGPAPSGEDDGASRFLPGVLDFGATCARRVLGFRAPAHGCPPRVKHCVTHPEHPFLDSSGTMTDLGTLGGNFAVGFAINRSGEVGRSFAVLAVGLADDRAGVVDRLAPSSTPPGTSKTSTA